MADFKPTAYQSAAITARDGAVLVSAGAGSGKTMVLTRRLMSRITDSRDPADVDSFLIITYTRAAAGELRARITDELAKALAADPGNKRLRRQSALCRRAQIGTIHSFCSRLMKEHSHLIGLTPDFKIIDDNRAASMKDAALERVMEQHYQRPADFPGFGFLADTVGQGRDDNRLVELVLSLYGKMQCHARPALWAKRQVELLRAPAEDVSETPWGREILSWALSQSEYWLGELGRVLAAMEGCEKINKAYAPAISDGLSALENLSQALKNGWDSARACLPISFLSLGRVVNSPDPELSEYVKNRWNAFKTAIKSLTETLSSDSSQLLNEMKLTAPAMEALLELTLSFDREYAKSKRRSGLVDYSDLEHLTAELLTEENGEPTALARQVSAGYTEIMVDEYQDVSLVQDAIFRAVSKDGSNLFMVGDVKQAIYRFRLADPGIFTEKYLSYADDACALPGQPRRIMLRENFRSRREIINCANSIFSTCMSRALGDMDYDESAALKYGASYEGEVPLPELVLIENPGADEDGDSPDMKTAEAEYVGNRIRELMNSGVTVGSGPSRRPLSYGDIAILLLTANTVGGVYRSALARQGIPVSAGQGRDFFRSVEVSTVMSMLAVTDNPHQDIPLIAVLRSPAFGFSPDELSVIRGTDKRGDFFSALEKAAEKADKCRDFLHRLDALRSAAPDMSAAELVWYILDDLDMPAICSAMSDGAQRNANLMELIELARRFESSGYKGLHRFVLYLTKLSEKGQDNIGGAATGEAVQIMSIHKSKGLEFPVVFFCDTAKRFNKKDNQETVLVHPTLGLGPKVTDEKLRVEYPSLARNAIKLRSERELLSEEMRLLYVALTRAKERLIITAAVKDAEKTMDKALASISFPMAPYVLSQTQSHFMWLLYSALVDKGRTMKLRITSPLPEDIQTPTAGADTVPNEAAAKELSRRLSYVYPHSGATTLPSKVTATELKGREERDGDAASIAPDLGRSFRMPDFGRVNRPVTGAERGVATHLVLQYMDFSAACKLEDIKGEINRLERGRFISPREAAAVDAGAIQKLFASPLGQRMLKAEKLWREFRFSLLWDAGEISASASGEELLMQGVVDCCIQEKDGLTVIDYKTDAVKTPAELAARTALYTGQLRAYAHALHRITGHEVKEAVLYFLYGGQIVNIPKKDLQ